MSLILSETFLSLTPDQQEALIDEKGHIMFYYPEQEQIIMSDDKLRNDMAETLKKVEELKNKMDSYAHIEEN